VKYPDTCPNPDCRQPITFWTESGWHDAEFITEFWRGCPVFRDARRRIDIWGEHWAKWSRSPWPDAARREYHHARVPHWIQDLVGSYNEVAR